MVIGQKIDVLMQYKGYCDTLCTQLEMINNCEQRKRNHPMNHLYKHSCRRYWYVSGLRWRHILVSHDWVQTTQNYPALYILIKLGWFISFIWSFKLVVHPREGISLVTMIIYSQFKSRSILITSSASLKKSPHLYKFSFGETPSRSNSLRIPLINQIIWQQYEYEQLHWSNVATK